MAALTAGRATPRRDPDCTSLPVAAGVVIYKGSIVVINAAGFACPGKTGVGVTVLGCAERRANATGLTDGAISVTVRSGICFKWANSTAADLITAAKVGQPCYVVDDQTVASNDGGGTRPVCGIIKGVEQDGVWVYVK